MKVSISAPMSMISILKRLTLLLSIIIFALAEPATLSAENILSANLFFSKSYYASNDKFSATLIINNSGPSSLRADISFTLHSRLALDQPLENKGKVIFQRSWRRAFLKTGENRLIIERSIPRLKLGPGAYPISITLSSQGETFIENSMLVVIDEPAQPSYPLALVLVWNFHERARFTPDGIFTDGKIQADISDDLANPGAYSNHLAALLKYPEIKANIVITPLLLEQLETMSKGFKMRQNGQTLSFSSTSKEAQRAGVILGQYRDLFARGQAQLIPTPYAYPSLAFLADQGWGEDIGLQINQAEQVLNETFDRGAAIKSLYPPGLKLNLAAIPYLVKKGVQETILSGSIFRQISSEGDIYKSYRIADEENNRLTVVFADEESSRALELKSAEAAKQILLGRLAEIYLLRPGEQKIVLLTPATSGWQPSRELLEALYGTLSEVPWLRTVSLKEALELVPPSTRPLTMVDQEEEKSYLRTQYYQRIGQARQDFQVFTQLVSEDNPLREKLGKLLLIAQGYDWIESAETPTVLNQGLKFIEEIEKTVSSELAKIRLISKEAVTLPSSRGKIPIAIFNGTGDEVKVTLQIKGKDFSFPGGRYKEVRLKPKENLFSFPIEAVVSRPARLTVAIMVGERVIDQARLRVNPTHFNQIVLLIGLLAIFGFSVVILIRWLRKKT